MMRLPAFVCLAVLVVALEGGYAQESGQGSSVNGRVMTTIGQPVADAFVDLVPVGGALKSARRTQSNDKGQFSFPGVAPGAYSILVENTARLDFFTDEQDDDISGPRICRPGDFVDVVVALEKRGIVTGRVTGPTGEPVVDATVRAFRVRDSRGRPVEGHSFFSGMPWERQTDDRGIYRMWLLEPGSYIISAGGEEGIRLTFRAPPPTDYDNDAPTYYSDSPSGEATAVMVRAGVEVGGIDIQYRGGRGHTISGTMSGEIAPGARNTHVRITNLATGTQQSNYISGGSPSSFSFSQLADGDYDIAATADFRDRQEEIASKTVRVTVRGADVSGITLEPIPFASVVGRVVLEPAADPNPKPDCQTMHRPLIEEVVLVFKRNQQSGGRLGYQRLYGSSSEVATGHNGDFAIPKLEPGTYHLKVDLPGDSWYINSMTAPGADSKPARMPALVSLKDGEHLSGFTISLGRGAARLHGKIVSATAAAISAQRLQIHLVPLEPTGADNPLRFAEAPVKTAGEFTMAHIGPGRYRLLALPAGGDTQTTLAETKEGRILLVRKARRNGMEIELGSCGKFDDIVLRYADRQ